MSDEPSLIESLSDFVGVIQTTYLYLAILAIGIALVVMGNTLARLIGGGLLAVWLYFALRRARKRFANPS